MSSPSLNAPPYDSALQPLLQYKQWLIVAWALILIQPVGLLLAPLLPQWIGWENGLLESLQTFTLFLGLLMALRGCLVWRGTPFQWWWLAIAPWWLGLLGRELAWGAAFMPIQGMTEWGPTISSQILGYKPWIKPIMLGLLVFSLGTMVVSGTLKAVGQRVWRERKMMPLGTLAGAIVVCAVLSTASEGHAFYRFIDDLGTQVIILEEWVEVWGYLALLQLQWCVWSRMRTWQRPTDPAWSF